MARVCRSRSACALTCWFFGCLLGAAWVSADRVPSFTPFTLPRSMPFGRSAVTSIGLGLALPLQCDGMPSVDDRLVLADRVLPPPDLPRDILWSVRCSTVSIGTSCAVACVCLHRVAGLVVRRRSLRSWLTESPPSPPSLTGRPSPLLSFMLGPRESCMHRQDPRHFPPHCRRRW